jgi:hypothetical protein
MRTSCSGGRQDDNEQLLRRRRRTRTCRILISWNEVRAGGQHAPHPSYSLSWVIDCESEFLGASQIDE